MSQRSARLVIRASDQRRARALQEALAKAGIDAVALAGARPAPDGEDLTLIDAEAPDAETFALAVRRAVPTSLALVGATMNRPLLSKGFDGWLSLADRPALLRRVLGELRRDGVAREESRARRRTAADLGLPAPPPRAPRKRKLSALFVGSPSTAFLSFEHAWAKNGGSVGATFTSFTAFDQLQDEQFDAVVLNAIDDTAAATSLATALRRNPGRHHLPVLALIEGEASEELERGAPFLARKGDDFGVTAAWLAASAERARDRVSVLDVLQSAPERRAPWTGPTLISHVSTLAGTHHTGGRPLAVAALRLAGRTEGDAHARFSELAGLTARLVRASDSLALLDEATLLIAFPCTDLDGARAAVTRITSVWGHSAFVADSPAKLRYRVQVLELAPGESGAGLLARVGWMARV